MSDNLTAAEARRAGPQPKSILDQLLEVVRRQMPYGYSVEVPNIPKDRAAILELTQRGFDVEFHEATSELDEHDYYLIKW